MTVSDIKDMKQRPKALMFLVLTAILWSLGGLLIKSVDTNPLAIAGIRSLIASAIIWTYLKKPKFNWTLAQIAAALSYAATVLLFVAANKLTTAANAILLQYTAPIYVAVAGAWLLKEKAKTIDWVTIGIVLGGMSLFFIGKLDTRGMLGNMLAAMSGISFGFLAVFMRMQKDGSPLESILLGNILTALIGISFLFGDLPGIKGWICLGALGVLQLGIPYILYASAIKYVTALEGIIIPVIEPILNPVWVLLLLGENPGIYDVLGGIVVVGAVTLRCVLPVLSIKKYK